ncbi:hypothetical protein V5O48_019082 [Marasmius crinis-equi]|uniref:Uncharacterized protein n=1 Tax=Marasmius crinis-equi TaxID=585013 RepID=A0ABR3EJD8_9AGAR
MPTTTTKRKVTVSNKGGSPNRPKRRKVGATAQVGVSIGEDSKDEVAEVAEEEEIAVEDSQDNTISVPEEAPVYIWKVAEMFERLKLGKDMKSLIEAWVGLEARTGFETTGMLTTSSRPPQVGEWIQHGRRPGFKAKIADVEVYGDKFAMWFKLCSPSWRKQTEGSIIMSRESGMDWSDMKITGQNGLASVVAALMFWKSALDGVPHSTARQKQARERLEGQFAEAFEEVSYSISQMT